MKLLNSPALSDSQDDRDDEEDNLEQGVKEADENGTKGDQDDHVYISLSIFCFTSLSA